MNWNDKLKQARKKAHITQQELADYMGVSRSTIANYEIARRKPSILELEKIARKLRVDVNYILDSNVENESNELITRATTVFSDTNISDSDKDLIFQDIMELYLKGKSVNNASKHRKRKF